MVKVEIDLTQELGALMEAEKDDFVADAAAAIKARFGLSDDDEASIAGYLPDFIRDSYLGGRGGLNLVIEVDVDGPDGLAAETSLDAAALKEAIEKIG